MATKEQRDDNLRQSISLLIQAQAQFVQNQSQLQAEFLTRHAEYEKRLAEYERANAERFARIERQLVEIVATLARHERMLEALPEAIRQKIGFRPAE